MSEKDERDAPWPNHSHTNTHTEDDDEEVTKGKTICGTGAIEQSNKQTDRQAKTKQDEKRRVAVFNMTVLKVVFLLRALIRNREKNSLIEARRKRERERAKGDERP